MATAVTRPVSDGQLARQVDALRPDVAWASIGAACGVFIGHALIAYLAFTGAIPAWLAIPVLATFVYLAYTPLHEACHGNIFRKRSALNDRLTAACGFLASAPMLHNFSLHRTTHLSHHKNLNDPFRDADHWVSGTGPVSVMARVSTVIFLHYVMGWRINRETAAGRRALFWGLVQNAVWIAVMIGLAFAGYGLEVLMFLVLPAFLGQIILGLTFDWSVHYPYSDGNRFETTTAYVSHNPVRSWLLNVLSCGQSYHLVHHLYPWLPFYRYASAYRMTESRLRERGARIVEV